MVSAGRRGLNGSLGDDDEEEEGGGMLAGLPLGWLEDVAGKEGV